MIERAELPVHRKRTVMGCFMGAFYLALTRGPEKRALKRLPWPGVLVMCSVAPWRPRACLTIARPNPCRRFRAIVRGRPGEALGQARDVLGGNADAGVLDFEGRALGIACQRSRTTPASGV